MLYQNEDKRNSIANLIVVLQLMSPLFLYYNLPLTSIGVTTTINLLSVFFGLFIIAHRQRIHIYKKTFECSFSCFTIYLFVSTVLLSFFVRYQIEIDMTLLNGFFVALILLIFPSKVNGHACLKAYKVIAFTSIAFFLFQFVVDEIIGMHIDFHIPFLALQEVYVSAFKSTSAAFFSEPAHFAQYITPLIVIALFGEKHKNKSIIQAVFLTIVCLMTLSGNGIVVCLILWIIFFIKRAREGKTKGLIWYIIGIIVISISFSVLSKIPEFMKVVNRLFYDRTGSTYSFTKANYRIYRGFDYYFQLPILNKCFGIGYKSLDSFKHLYGLSSVYDTMQASEYLNAICQVLIYSGLVGFIFYIRSLINLGKNNSLAGVITIVTFLLLSVSSSILLDSTMIMYIFIVAAHKKIFLRKNEKEKCIYELPHL